MTGFVIKRNATGRTSEAGYGCECERHNWRAVRSADRESGIVAEWIFKKVHIRKRQVREIHAYQRAGRTISDSRRKMLLNDEPCRARRQRLLIAAEKSRC